jgi:hypothetical protein
MAAALLDIATFALAIAAFMLSVRKGLILTVAVVTLIPATLVAPNPVGPGFTVTRLVLLGFVAGLVYRTRTGEISRQAWRPGKLHLLALGYLVVALIDGVAIAVPTVSASNASLQWWDVLDQMVCLLVGLTAFRHVRDSASRRGERYPLMPLTAGLLVVLACIGVIEHLTHTSWAQLLYTGQHSQQAQDAAHDLISRDGDRRVRASAQYAIEYGWLCAALLPTLLITLLRRHLPRPTARFVLLPIAVVLVLGAMYWSYTRTAFAAVALGVVLLGALTQDRRFVTAAGATLAAAGAAIVANPGLITALSPQADQGSINVRSERLPIVFQLAATHPLHGLGFGGLDFHGIPTTDTSWLLVYADLGVLGLVAVILLFVNVIAECARGLRATDEQARLTSAAVIVSVILVAVAGFAYDTLSLMTTGRLLWLLAAAGIAAAETVPRPAAVPWQVAARARLPRAALGAALGVTSGLALWLSWPHTSIARAQFDALPAAEEAGNYDSVDIGRQLISSSCSVLDGLRTPDLSIECWDAQTGAGIGYVRVTSRSSAAINRFLATASTRVRATGLPDFRVLEVDPPIRALPTPVRVAPLGLPLCAAAVLLMLPAPEESRRNRKDRSEPDSDDMSFDPLSVPYPTERLDPAGVAG